MKKFAFRFLLALLLLSMLAQPFCASEMQTGSITLEYSYDGVPYPDQTVGIYRVAEIASNGDHTLIAPYDGFPVNIGGITAQKEWQDAADTLAAYITGNGLEPEKTALTDGNGIVVFENLEEGIYLISGVTISDDRGTCRFENFFLFLPSTGEDGTSSYAVAAKPKADFTPQEEDLPEYVTYQVVKVWKDSGHRDSRPNQITVDLLKDGALQETVRLHTDNNWTYQWQTEAGDGTWSVMERDVPDEYKVVITQNSTVFQVTNTYTAKTEVPKTGDTAALWLYVLAMCLSGFGLLIIAIGAKRRGNREKNQ